MVQVAGRHRREDLRAGNTVAFLVSLVIHVTLLLALACWVYTAGKPSEGLLLTAEIGQSTDTKISLLPDEELPVAEFETTVLPVEPQFVLDVKLDGMIEVPEVGGADQQAVSAALTSVSVRDVARGLEEASSGRGASFFGAKAYGDRFVFVLDSSHSMKGDRWLYACNQLIDSLNGLSSGQEFFVLCFDAETTFLFNQQPARSKYYRADRETVARVKRWLRSRTLGRATMPAEALQYALTFSPDAIFLLSDGELQDDTLSRLKRLNGFSSSRRQIPIHTVHLFSAKGRGTLRRIARENSGSFTPVVGH
ncbi:vWA domain-containing protein [Aureliella helgolandensis]|uniref:VWFA domain-containing protein n=1 Tax=Aureliella helgolandensis TaxID=2527968 RepID=A0A518GGN2_9BACT|nr:vWA domain-containing protein [Aureliella helgolandensis]QDV27755.1 hypothetical protein Q31a_61480 [Aureliella helgolandensis]